ncbi:MAG: DUF1080 domain-containing protein [Pirellulales bacterium]|nr:DUF1080 domain-containing protein [Pirellulales bacterium]
MLCQQRFLRNYHHIARGFPRGLAAWALLGCILQSAFSADKPAASPAADPRTTTLFDGKTLTGWSGDEKMFRVEDNAIVCGTLAEKIPHNFFLATDKEYKNFELRLKFKLAGEGINSGIQLRSRRIPNHHEMIGYQADLGSGYFGALYDESRRNKILSGPDQAKIEKILKPGEWNDYRIRCEGPRIQLWINGQPTVDYTEEDQGIEQTGHIALQIHGGPPSAASFKDIELTPLPD